MSQTYKKLFYGTAMDVAKLCSVLDTLGIIPVVKDQAESARLAGFKIICNNIGTHRSYAAPVLPFFFLLLLYLIWFT